ncbi:MAG: hypothetical protein J5723_02540 [Ruminococcus sp.]|nr:hypothetical protein [Ruminococcus sp.]
MGTINTDIWGQPLAYFTMFNERTGAADLTDPDFTDYPPFTYNEINTDWSDPSGTTYPYTIRAGIAKGDFIPTKKYPDYSIAYVGIYESSLPQNDIVCIGQAPNTPSGSLDYSECFISQPDSILPLMFISNRAYRYYRGALSTYTATNRSFANPLVSSTSANLKKYFAPNTRDDASSAPLRNMSYDMAYWRLIGIRSVIGVIYVKYVNAELNSSTGLPSTYNYQPVSLKWYKEQTTEWKTAHPLTAAFLRLIPRSNIDGTYSVMNRSDSCMPDLTLNIIPNKSVIPNLDNYDIPCISPAQMIAGETNAQMHLPIFGSPNACISSEGGVLNQIGSTPSGGGMNTGHYPLYVGYHSGELHHGTGTSTNQRETWITTDGTGDLEWIMRGAAAYGLFFTDGTPTEYPDIFAAGNDVYRWVNENMCLGVVDENGYTHGDYTRGMANPTAPNFTWSDTSKSPYDPKKPKIPTNDYSSATVFNNIGDLATLTRRYVLNSTAVEHLGRELWQITADMIDDGGGGVDFSELNEKILDTFLTNNPIDCIVSLQRYPMEVPKSASPVKIKLGKAETNVSAYLMEKAAYFYLFQGKPIAPKFADSFLDYEPYTKMELYVPFCGTIQLNPADIIDRDLNVQLVVDFTTGTATGFVMSDDLVIETVNGNIAIDIPVTGIQSATVASQLNNAIANKSNANKQAMQATLGNVSVGGLIRAVKDPMNMIFQAQQADIAEQRADYELQHQNAPVHIIGSASAVGAWAIDLNCRLIIYYPTGDIIRSAAVPDWNNTQLAMYGKTTGFACCIESSIENMGTGLVVGTAPDLRGMVTDTQGYAATASELDMIKAAIAEGVIV